MTKTSLMLLTAIGVGLAGAAGVRAEAPDKAPVVKSAPVEVVTPGQPPFQPVTIDPELVKKSMQARSEYEDLNRKIIARQTQLYADNATIKDLQAKMRDIQAKIDAILAEDETLKKLKEKFQSVSPAMPIGMKKPASGALTPATAPEKTDKKPDTGDKK